MVPLEIHSQGPLPNFCRWIGTAAAIPTPTVQDVLKELSAVLEDEDTCTMIAARAVKGGRVMSEGEYVEVDEIELPERPPGASTHKEVDLPPQEKYMDWMGGLVQSSEALALFRYSNVPQRVPEAIFWHRMMRAILLRFEQARSDVSHQQPQGW